MANPVTPDGEDSADVLDGTYEMLYGEGVRKNDRLQVSVVAYDDGGSAEVFWARSRDILTMEHEGSAHLHPDGSLTMKVRRADDEPLYLYVLGNRLVVSNDDNLRMPNDPEFAETVIFDSDRWEATNA